TTATRSPSGSKLGSSSTRSRSQEGVVGSVGRLRFQAATSGPSSPAANARTVVIRLPRALRVREKVELWGFEPQTSSMPWKRATNCAIAPDHGSRTSLREHIAILAIRLIAGGLGRLASLGVGAVVAADRLGEGAGVVLQQPPSSAPLVEHGPRAVAEAADGGPVFLRQPEQLADAEPQRRPVGGDDEQPVVVELGRPAPHGGGDPRGDVGHVLAARRLPGDVLAGPAFGDLGVGETLPLAAAALPEVLVDRHVEAGDAGEGQRGVVGPFEIGGHDEGGPQRGEQGGGPGRLGHAGLVERDVGVALETVLHVPAGLPVAEADDASAQLLALWVLACVTLSGRAMAGQSFHSRSRA